MKVYLTILFFLLSFLSISQNEMLDSLHQVVRSGVHDTVKVKTYNHLAKIFTRSDPEACLKYADSAIFISGQIDYQIEIGKSFMHKANAYRYLDDYDEALSLNYEAINIFEELGEQKLIGGCHINIGIIMQMLDKLDESEEHYLIAREIMIAEEDLYGGGSVCQNIGILHAIDSNFAEAITYFNEALEMFEKIGYVSGMARLNDNIGLCYAKLGDYDKALIHNEKGYELHASIEDPFGKISALSSRSEIYYDLGEYQSALRSLKEAEEIAISTAYTDLKKDIYQSYYHVYESLGDYKNALFNYKKFKAYEDSISMTQNNRILEETEAKYQNVKKEKEIALLSKNEELNQLKIQQQDQQIEKDKNRMYALYVGLFLVLLVAGISIYSFVQKKKDNQIISQQKKEVEEKHAEITDSINYAEKIQTAILGNQDVWNEIGADRFIYFRPKEQVSGDFYWCSLATRSKEYAWVAADCTGHGVPGAMMSMLGVSVLNETFREIEHIKPAEVLSFLREKIIQSLHNKNEENQRRDGMDMALCVYNPDTKILSYAGANNPLWIISKREHLGIETKNIFDEQSEMYLHEIKGTKQPVGLYTAELKDYQSHELKMETGEIVYTFSDGFADQFGGDKGKKLKYANFKKLLLSMVGESPENQKDKLDEHFRKWMGDFEQVDDVLVIGVKMS